MWYACIAGVEPPEVGLKPYRCRKMAVDPPKTPICRRHIDGWYEGHPIAPSPDIVLLKVSFPSTSSWRRDFGDLGFRFVDRGREKTKQLDKQHPQHAEAFGRGAYVIRKNRSDSGVKVFGDEGLKNAGLGLIDGELTKAGLELASSHVLDRSWEGQLTLVLEYASNVARSQINTSSFPVPGRAIGFVRSQLGMSRNWGTVHVFANPPSLKPDSRGVIFHTINVGVGRDDVPSVLLTFNAGLWGSQDAISR